MESNGGEDGGYERTEQRASLEPALETLPQREREILRMRFEDGLTQTQIADRIGISQMPVSRLIRKSLARMRAELTSRHPSTRSLQRRTSCACGVGAAPPFCS